MSEVIIGEQESFESALRRFSKKVMFDGILAETKRRSRYEKPSDKKRREIAKNKRRLLKKKLRSEARMRERR